MMRFKVWKRCRRVLVLLAVLGALLIPAYAADELNLSDARAPKGEYTATLEEMAVKRLYAYGFLDAPDETEEKKDAVLPIQLDGTPDRLDAALMLYRACGAQPEAPCPLLDVPEEYADAVAWLYESGATKGVGNSLYGTGNVMGSEYPVMDTPHFLCSKLGNGFIAEQAPLLDAKELDPVLCKQVDVPLCHAPLAAYAVNALDQHQIHLTSEDGLCDLLERRAV